MGKLDEFIEKKGGIVMSVFLSIQTLIFMAYTFMFCYKDRNIIYLDIFVIISLFIFLIFMIHFAYHSVRLFNIDS